MQVTGWKSSRVGGTLGLRVGKENAQRFFPRNWHSVGVELDGQRVIVPITNTFWTSCPELRSPFIRDFLEEHGLAHWRKGRPPKLRLLPRPGNTFVVSLE
jgi:hypothetical protein